MAFKLFKKGDKGDGAGGGAVDTSKKRRPRKAEAFFRHAATTADSRQYDYSIDCYVNGLRHDPANLFKHEALNEVALRRKVAGGKTAGFKERMKSGGKDVVDRLVHAEKLWALDPLNVEHMIKVMERAAEVHQEEDDLDLAEFIAWIGDKVLEANAITKKKEVYEKASELFTVIPYFAKAAEACRRAVQLDNEDEVLLQRLKELEAETTMQEGGYESAGGKEGGYRDMVKDEKAQKILDAEDQVGAASAALEEAIETRRAEHEEDPQDHVKMGKLVKVLLQRNADEADEEAMELLTNAWEQTGQYRFKVQAGDVKMRQMRRHQHALKKKLEADRDNEALKEQWRALWKEQLEFELAEFAERAKNYPTDMGIKFQYGLRLHRAEKHDEAIAAFQEAQADPKNRALASDLLGQCYIVKEWFDEAIETLQRGIALHPHRDDKLGLELRYRLLEAMEKQATRNRDLAMAKEARKIASEILQMNINYRDIRDRSNAVRKLVDELQAGASA